MFLFTNVPSPGSNVSVIPMISIELAARVSSTSWNDTLIFRTHFGEQSELRVKKVSQKEEVFWYTIV